MESETKPKGYVDNYGRQAEIRKAHDENIQVGYATIAHLDSMCQVMAMLTQAVNRLAKAIEEKKP